MDDAALRYARTHVELYTRETGVLNAHQEAMQCRDCEDYLQIGIDAFHWLERADQRIREALVEQAGGRHPGASEALTTLYETWLEACSTAEKVVKPQLDHGFEIDNLEEFRRCCEHAADIVASRRMARIGFEALANSEESW